MSDDAAFNWVLGILVALVLIVFTLLVAATVMAPTCQERGGHEKFSHFLPIWVGKTVVLAPQYTCEGATS